MKQCVIPTSLLRGIAIVLFIIAFLFPPADYHSNLPVLYGLGASLNNEGFVFLGEIGGDLKIRYPQWIVQLMIIGVAAFFIFKIKANIGINVSAVEEFIPSRKTIVNLVYIFIFIIVLLIVATIFDEYDRNNRIEELKRIKDLEASKNQVTQNSTVSQPAITPKNGITNFSLLPASSPVPTPQTGKLIQKKLTPQPSPTPSQSTPSPAPLKYVLNGFHKNISIPRGSKLRLYDSPIQPQNITDVIESGEYKVLISDITYLVSSMNEWVLIEIDGKQGWVPSDSF